MRKSALVRSGNDHGGAVSLVNIGQRQNHIDLAATENAIDVVVSPSHRPLISARVDRMMAPAFEKVSQDLHGRARFVKVNTEDEQGLAAAYNIRSIPTLAVFAGGREITRQPGAMSAPDLVRWVSAALPKS
ncbi:MAG: thiol reductase thioredoxin [Betaproteobacteria bacterium]|nr:thiol reductase thioredoxin [Betaproteobacteria bacterium]